jgi:CRISPR/Cas system-associated exonuclease Cas4 (RecB family)
MSLLDDWTLWWKETEKERKEYDLTDTSNWRVASPRRNPEDGDWWFTNGYKFYENWVNWRKANPHMQIARVGENTIGIELEMAPKVNGVAVKMFIDRLFFDAIKGEYAIVDLKTGKTTPGSSLQLAFYAYGLRKTYDIQVNTGYYWMARKGELSEPFNLADMTDDKIELLVTMFDKARKENLFLPNFNSCNMCGYSAVCDWKTKETDNE